MASVFGKPILIPSLRLETRVLAVLRVTGSLGNETGILRVVPLYSRFQSLQSIVGNHIAVLRGDPGGCPF